MPFIKNLYAVMFVATIGACSPHSSIAKEVGAEVSCNVADQLNSREPSIEGRVFIKVFNKRLIVPAGFMFVHNENELIYAINRSMEAEKPGAIQVGRFDEDQAVGEVLSYLKARGASICKLDAYGLYVSRQTNPAGYEVSHTVRIFDDNEYITIISPSETLWIDVIAGLVPL